MIYKYKLNNIINELIIKYAMFFTYLQINNI
jgi:hypothetical protein